MEKLVDTISPAKRPGPSGANCIGMKIADDHLPGDARQFSKHGSGRRAEYPMVKEQRAKSTASSLSGLDRISASADLPPMPGFRSAFNTISRQASIPNTRAPRECAHCIQRPVPLPASRTRHPLTSSDPAGEIAHFEGEQRVVRRRHRKPPKVDTPSRATDRCHKLSQRGLRSATSFCAQASSNGAA